MGYFIGKIEIEGFRGINNDGDSLEIKLKTNQVNSIFAPNGLCKSSIFEAMCFAVKGIVPKLDRLHKDEKPEDYYTNRFHSGGKATIKLTFVSSIDGKETVVQVERDSTGKRIVSSPSGHKDPSSFLNELAEDTILLDYETFRRFVEESPLVRGRSFASLLGLSTISQTRQALETLANGGTFSRDFQMSTLDSELRNASSTRDAALAKIRTTYQKVVGQTLQEPINATQVITDVTNSVAGLPILKTSFDKKDISTVDFSTVKSAIKNAENSNAHSRLASVIKEITIVEDLSPGSSESIEYESLKKHISTRDTALSNTGGSLLKTLYEAAIKVIESGEWPDPSKCPACESVPTTSPKDHVTQHLAQYQAAAQAESLIRSTWSSATANTRLKKLEDIFFKDPHDTKRSYKNLDETIRLKHPTIIEIEAVFTALTEVEELRKTSLESLQTEKQHIQTDLPPSLVTLTEQVEYAEQLRDALKSHKESLKDVAIVQYRIQERNNWKAFVENARDLFASAENEFTGQRVSNIQDRFQKIHKTISGIEQIKPVLAKVAGSEDLFLKLEKFYDLTDIPAVPLLNESYRNALAISIFLSAALENKGKPRFIILDDITSSFDAGHQFALMEVLRNEVGLPNNPNGLQVIILSHDGLLEKYFDRMSGTKEWHHQRLQGSPPMGSVFTQDQDANRLRANAERFLNAGQVPQAEPLIRQYLEFTLLQVINKVRVPVPLDFVIRNDLHMVKNCLEAITNGVDLHKKAKSLILNATQENNLDRIVVPALVGNWLSHYETAISAGLAPSVLLSVLNTVDQFADCFKYDCKCEGSTIRRYYRTLDSKHCKC